LPVKLSGETIVILHLLPLDSFDPLQEINFSLISTTKLNTRPMFSTAYDERYNFYGFLTFSKKPDKPGYCNSYTQLFKNGCIESSTSTYSENEMHNQRLIQITEFENEIISNIDSYLKTLQNLNISTPIFIMLTMFGFKNFKFYYFHKNGRGSYGYKIDEENLIFEPVILDSFDVNISQLVKPIFDSLWNSFGAAYSLNYDTNGIRIK